MAVYEKESEGQKTTIDIAFICLSSLLAERQETGRMFQTRDGIEENIRTELTDISINFNSHIMRHI